MSSVKFRWERRPFFAERCNSFVRVDKNRRGIFSTIVLQVQCRPRAATALFATTAHALAPRGGSLLRKDNDVARHMDASGEQAFHNVSMMRHG
jgi:hypothetical protein